MHNGMSAMCQKRTSLIRSPQPAFENACGKVGCPDRQIDRLCITCCLPFPTFTSRRMAGAISLRRKRDGLLVAFALGHHGPGHPCDLVGKRNGGDLGGPTRQERRKPRTMLGAMDLA